MTDERKSGYCKECMGRKVVFRKGTNHILHLILSVLTMGFWIIVWVGSSIKFGGWRCSECGSTKLREIR